MADSTQLRSRVAASPAPLHDSLVRSEGLEPPRFYSLPPQGSASTNSATSALRDRHGICPGPDQRRRCNKSMVEGQGLLAWWFCLAGARQSRQHLLDFDRDTVAIDKHHAAGYRQVVGEELDLVRFGRVQFDDGATAQAHYLMDGHRSGS